MVYITVKQSPSYHQMTLEEFLFGGDDVRSMINPNTTNTRTYEFERVSDRFASLVDVDVLTQKLKAFNDQYVELRNQPRQTLYKEFKIPKKSHGFRTIDAPNPELMDALRRLKTIFEVDFGALYHTSAYAYIRGRSTIRCMKKHQEAESRWFAKYDLHNFFGSTTPEFVMQMFSMVFPFSQVVQLEDGRRELETALSLAFLNGGLPQGTPISPLITNIMMIPVDFRINKALRDFNGQRFVYTRYADDFQVSSRYGFCFRDVEALIVKTLKDFNAPFMLNAEKTRYGSSSGSNWNLGVMLNKDNQLTVGYKAKKRFKAALASYIMDKKNGREWDRADLQSLDGYYNYYRMVEGDTIDRIIDYTNKKFEVDVIAMIRNDIKS